MKWRTMLDWVEMESNEGYAAQNMTTHHLYQGGIRYTIQGSQLTYLCKVLGYGNLF